LLRFLTQSGSASQLKAHFLSIQAGLGYNPLAGGGWHPASEFLEVVSKPHLRSNGPPIFVADCRPPINAHILHVCCAFSIDLRLALEADMRFLNNQ
jgi:hypothetical protein